MFFIADNGRNVWTSGTDAAVEGQYMWASTGYAFSYFDWYPGQPQNVNGLDDAMVLWWITGVLAWHDYLGTETITIFPLCEKLGIV